MMTRESGLEAAASARTLGRITVRRRAKALGFRLQIPAALLGIVLPAGICAAGCPAPTLQSTLPETYPLEGDVERVHDPSLGSELNAYYVLSTDTGQPGNLPIRRSSDRRRWQLIGAVFETIPDWIRNEISGVKNLWAPDVSSFSGKYHVYYSASTFGSNRSLIALATNRTLDPASPDYQWVDEGKVIESFEADDWNAIDPNIFLDENGQVWMSFGSFWSGIKMRRIDPTTGKLSSEDRTLYSLASRPRSEPIHGAIEAPFVIRQGDHYLPLRLLRPVLPRRGEHLQHPRRPRHGGYGALRGQGRNPAA